MVKNTILCALLVAAFLFLLLSPPPLPPRIGAIDLPAYWSASYLLAQGENFAEPSQLFRVERSQTSWPENYPMLTWNPPWLLVLLLPYTLIPFPRAVWWWLLTNITLVFVSAVLLWQVDSTLARTRRLAWLGPLIAFAYSPTLVAIIAGQVNILVFAGLGIYLWFVISSRGARWRMLAAGAALALTMVKFHLVYLTVPLLLLDAARRRQWHILLGFGMSLTASMALVFFLRPTFVFEYARTIGAGGLLQYETPTFGGIVAGLTDWNGVKLMGIVLLPLSILAWWRRGANWDLRTLVDVTLLASVITAPFGWSYDFVVLLIPLLRIVVWMTEGLLPRAQVILLALVLLGADAYSYYERIASPGEIYFSWIPWLIALTYGFAWWQVNHHNTNAGLEREVFLSQATPQ